MIMLGSVLIPAVAVFAAPETNVANSYWLQDISVLLPRLLSVSCPGQTKLCTS